MGVFEDFVNANLPLRVVQYNPLNSGYDYDPNDAGALTQIKNAPKGAFYYNSTGSLYVKSTTNSGSWVLVGSGVGGGGSGEVSASYVVLNLTSSLANERVLSASTGLYLTDGGAGNNVYFRINDSVVATLSGSIFNGRLFASGGLTGSLQQVGPGIPYLIATGTVGLATQSNGQILISGAAEPENFSYTYIPSGSTVVIPQYQQMLYDGDITVDGTLVLLGDIVENNDNHIAYALQVSNSYVIVSHSNPPTLGQVLMATSTTTATWQSLSSSVQQLTFWTVTGSTTYTTSSVVIGKAQKINDVVGSDAFFYVSGNISSSTNKAVFGGDVRISGTLTVGTGSVIITSNDIQFGSFNNRIALSGSQIKMFDSNNTNGVALTNTSLRFVSVVTSSMTASYGTAILTNISSSNIDVVLPDATIEINGEIFVKIKGYSYGRSIFVKPNITQTIDDGVNVNSVVTMSNDNESGLFKSDGSNWWRMY